MTTFASDHPSGQRIVDTRLADGSILRSYWWLDRVVPVVDRLERIPAGECRCPHCGQAMSPSLERPEPYTPPPD